MDRVHTLGLRTLQAQHEQALAAHRSALQQEVEQLRAQLKQQASNHAAEAQVGHLTVEPTSM